MLRAVGLWLLALLALALPAAAAHRCGDDVDGHPAACGCGDLLVSSRTLGPADHVTRDRCGADGLIVLAPGPVTLTFAGRTIRGEGQGTGLLVLSGSLSLVGPGTVEGFGIGLFARGGQRLRSAVRMRFAGNQLDGAAVVGDGFTIEGSEAEGNGRDGFALGGHGYALDGNLARHNGRYGFGLAGTGAQIGSAAGNEAAGNHMEGFLVRGMMHEVVRATAVGNGRDGLYAAVMHGAFVALRADGNQGDGVVVKGMGVTVGDSSASGNRGMGIWVNAMGTEDQGGNRGTGNGGYAGFTNVRPVVFARVPALAQCRIGMTGACR